MTRTGCAMWSLGTSIECASSDVDRRRNVLHERASGGDVQHLHAAADREDRHIARDRLTRERDLEPIPLGVHLCCRVRRFAIQGRVDVETAAQEQAVDAVQALRGIVRGFENDRLAAGAFHGLDVVVDARAACDAD